MAEGGREPSPHTPPRRPPLHDVPQPQTQQPFIEVNHKWMGKILADILTASGVPTQFSRRLGVVDFMIWMRAVGTAEEKNPFAPFVKTAITYIPQRHMQAGGLYKVKNPTNPKDKDKGKGGSYFRRIIRLKKAYQVDHNRNILLIEKTTDNNDYLESVRVFAVQKLGMMTITVTNQAEMAQFLLQTFCLIPKLPMRVYMKDKERKEGLPDLQEVKVVHTLKCLRIERKACKRLAKNFHSIRAIANASITHLRTTVDIGYARTIHAFFNGNILA